MPRPVRVKGADHVLEFLVRDHAADEHHVRPAVVEPAGEHAIGSHVEVREIGDHGEDAGVAEAETLELLAVVLGIAERQIAPCNVGGQLAPAAEAQLHQVLVHADEVLGRRDVVVHERHPAGQRVCRPRRPRADREVVDHDVVRIARLR